VSCENTEISLSLSSLPFYVPIEQFILFCLLNSNRITYHSAPPSASKHRQSLEAPLEGVPQHTGIAIIRFVGWNILRAILGCIVIGLLAKSECL
jgi:hypothetical protein